MATWDSYTQKATPEDNDTLMIKDTAGGANQRTPFSGVWNWIVKKLASAVISQLETTNKSIIPAINELNSKSKSGCAIRATIGNDNLQTDEDIRQYIYDNYRNSSYVAAFGIFSNVNTSHNVPAGSGGFMLAYFSASPGYAIIVYFTYSQKIYSSKMSDNVWSDWVKTN